MANQAASPRLTPKFVEALGYAAERSEERRVGKECW